MACLACSEFDHRDRPRGDAVLEAVKSVSRVEAAARPRTIMMGRMLIVRKEDSTESRTISQRVSPKILGLLWCTLPFLSLRVTDLEPLLHLLPSAEMVANQSPKRCAACV